MAPTVDKEHGGAEAPAAPGEARDPGLGAGATSGFAEGSGVLEDVVGAVEAFVDYLTARLRLEAFRAGLRARSLAGRLAAALAACALLLLGFVLLSVGLAGLLGRWLGSPPLGWLALGGAYLAIGVVVLFLAVRRRSGSDE